MAELLLRVLSGSRMYGLQHEESDYDYMEVYGWDKQKPKHTVTPTLDTLKVSFSDFLRHANNGSPKFVEAMFAAKPEFSTLEHLRKAWRPSLPACRHTYHSMTKSLWLEGVETDNVKKRRHAVRLQLNLWDLEDFGRFKPELSPRDRLLVLALGDSRNMAQGAAFLGL
jgi:predicted nucleotidyltransferase